MQGFIMELVKEKFPIKGIIQVGSNTGQECSHFRHYTANIICFEPIPSVFNVLQSSNPDLTCYNIALGDVNETKNMNISSNGGESSSFLEPLHHLNEFKSISFNSQLNLEIKRFDSLDIDMNNFNILVSDTQGYEINVLKGFGKKLKDVDVIYVEYCNELYVGDSSLNAISEYLEEYEFELIGAYPESDFWGNALYFKKIK